MAECNKVLQASGAKAWPRTCARCKIGPCNHKDHMNMGEKREHNALKEIAGRIQSLSYRDMNTLASRFLGQFPDGGERNLDFDEGEVAEALLKVAGDILKETAS